MTKEGRPGLRRKQSDYTIINNGVSNGVGSNSNNNNKTTSVIQKNNNTDRGQATSWINADEPRRSTYVKNMVRRRPERTVKNIRRPSSSDSSSSSSSNSSSPYYEINSFSSSSPECKRERTPTSIMDINLDSGNINLDLSNLNKEDFPSDLILPQFDSTHESHDHWIVWRVYSAEIHVTLEKHIDMFGGRYLSNTLLGEIFYEKINDDNVDFDPSVEFQAVQITKMHDVFLNEMNGEKRLTINAVVVKTASNIDLSETETRLVYAVDSLAELLEKVVKKDDYMLIFGQNSLVNCDTIALNSRHQQLVLIAVYRHDGIFSPEVEQDSDNVVISFDSKKFYYLFQEHEDENETVLRIQPRNVSRPGNNDDTSDKTSTAFCADTVEPEGEKIAVTATPTTVDNGTNDVSINPWLNLVLETQVNFTQASVQISKNIQGSESDIVSRVEEERDVVSVPSRVRAYKKEFGLKDCTIILKRVKVPKSRSTTSVTSKLKKKKGALRKIPWIDLHPDTQVNFTPATSQIPKINQEEESDVVCVPSRVEKDYKKKFGLKDCSIMLKRVKVPNSTRTTSITSKLKKKKEKTPPPKSPKVQKRTRFSPRRVQKNEEPLSRRVRRRK